MATETILSTETVSKALSSAMPGHRFKVERLCGDEQIARGYALIRATAPMLHPTPDATVWTVRTRGIWLRDDDSKEVLDRCVSGLKQDTVECRPIPTGHPC